MSDYSNHVPGFTKLFSGIVHSTVWREPMHIKVVWITMLALADRNGHVLVSMPGLADAARVTLPQCEEALKKLSSPDTHSRTKTNHGRRIREMDGGWALLNYLKYRSMRDEENRRGQVRDAVRRYRKRSLSDVINVSHVSQSKPIAEAEAEAEAGRTEGSGPSLPPADRAERAIRQSTDALRDKLYSLIDEMALIDPKQRDPTELMRLVTGYTKANGQTVKGVVNAHLLTHERLEKSIGDAELNLDDWRKRHDS